MATTAPRKSDMTDAQRKVQRNIDLATDTVIAYTAPVVPPMGNLTKEGLIEDFGRLNNARKAFEKTEATIKERIKSLIEKDSEHRTDNFTLTWKNQPRLALNQARAKKYFEERGILADFMDETEVMTMRIEEN